MLDRRMALALIMLYSLTGCGILTKSAQQQDQVFGLLIMVVGVVVFFLARAMSRSRTALIMWFSDIRWGLLAGLSMFVIG